MKWILMVGFSHTLDTGQVEDQKMIKRQTNRWKGIVSRFKGKLVKMIKDGGNKFDDYLISPNIRQFYYIGGYELTEKNFFINSV